MKVKRTDKATVIVVLAGVVVYLAVMLVLGVLWRKKSWLIGVGVIGLLGAATLLCIWLNWPMGLLLLFLFLSPYSASGSLWLVYPVAILPWILLAAVIWREGRAAKTSLQETLRTD